MSGTHDEDLFEDANENLQRAGDSKEATPEPVEQVNDNSSPSKKKKKNKKKNKNKSASQSQLDLNQDEDIGQNAEDIPQIPVGSTSESQENDTKQIEESSENQQDTEQTPQEMGEEQSKEEETVSSPQPETTDGDDEHTKQGEAVEGAEVAKEDGQLFEKLNAVKTEESEPEKPADGPIDSSEQPLSRSTDDYQEDSKELQEENKKLEAKLQELQLLDEDTTTSSTEQHPELPDRSNTARPVPVPPLPSRDPEVKAFPFPIPVLPPKNSAVSSPASASAPPPLPSRDEEPGSPQVAGAKAFTTKATDLPPPPLPPQLTPAQKSQHRGSVFNSWFGRGSVSSTKETTASISEKSVEYEENYDLLLSRLNETTEEFQSKDDSFKEQVTTSEDTLKSSFQQKVSILEDTSKDDSAQDSELNKIDWPFWTQVVNDYSATAKSEPSRLSKEISKGIPKQIRGIVWQLIAKSNPKEFEEKFKELLEKESPFEKNIQKDLSRTSYITENGIDSDALYKVIKVYSLIDTEVGYTQGMAFIVVPLLLNLNELESLSLLHRLMNSYNLRSLYLPDMPGLLLILYQFDRLVEDSLPNLHIHLQRQGVRSSMYASQWFLTFFAYKFPLEFVLRIYDIVITEGYESLLKFAIALISKNEEKLLTLQFDELLEYLKVGLFSAYQIVGATENSSEESHEDSHNNLGEFFKIKRSFSAPITVDTYDVDKLVEDATNVKIIPLTLKRYQEEYDEIHRQEKERREEIEDIRLRNNQLKREIRKIESSYTILNREHVQIANEMINGRMKIATLEDENKDLKEQNDKLRERVKSLQTPTDIEIPSSLEDDLKLTMERNLEVMTKNEELENQVSELLKEIEDLKAKEAAKEEELKVETKGLGVTSEEPGSPNKHHHRHHSTSSPAANWTKSFFKR